MAKSSGQQSEGGGERAVDARARQPRWERAGQKRGFAHHDELSDPAQRILRPDDSPGEGDLTKIRAKFPKFREFGPVWTFCRLFQCTLGR
jgi:hypothetical protein